MRDIITTATATATKKTPHSRAGIITIAIGIKFKANFRLDNQFKNKSSKIIKQRLKTRKNANKMENNTDEKKRKQIPYSELLEKEYRNAFEVLEKNGYVFEKSLSFQLHKLNEHLPEISNVLQITVQETKLIKEVCNFFEDTNGKHLCLLGSCGVGKTLLATKIIPLIFCASLKKIFKVIKARDLNEKINEAKNYPFVVIDDFGTESTAVNFGNKVEAFNEVIDSVEGRKCFFVVTSNLDANQIKQKYGVRTYDRLRGLFKVIQINEKSMR